MSNPTREREIRDILVAWGSEVIQQRLESVPDLKAAYEKAKSDPEVEEVILYDPYPQMKLKFRDGLILSIDARCEDDFVVWSWARDRGGDMRRGELSLRPGEPFEWSDLV